MGRSFPKARASPRARAAARPRAWSKQSRLDSRLGVRVAPGARWQLLQALQNRRKIHGFVPQDCRPRLTAFIPRDRRRLPVSVLARVAHGRCYTRGRCGFATCRMDAGEPLARGAVGGMLLLVAAPVVWLGLRPRATALKGPGIGWRAAVTAKLIGVIGGRFNGKPFMSRRAAMKEKMRPGEVLWFASGCLDGRGPPANLRAKASLGVVGGRTARTPSCRQRCSGR